MNDKHTPDLRFDVPHGARIWNYWLGGKDNYPADREVADAVSAHYPQIVTDALSSRQFLIRAVTFLAGEKGIRQFIDIGTGLPTMQNTHEVAQGVAPDAKIVYVDNDPLMLSYARALLVNTTPEGVTTYIDADYNDPELIISSARDVLDFEQPIAVMFMGVFGYVPDHGDVHSIIKRVLDAVPSGSYMALWDSTDTSAAIRAGAQAQADLGSPYQLRSIAQVGQWFEGLELVEPGLVSITQWRPETSGVERPEPIDAYCAVARKP